MQYFQSVLRVFRYLSKKQSFQLVYRRRESSLTPYNFLLNNYNGRRFRHFSYNYDNFRVVPFMAFGIMVAHCANNSDENINKPGRLFSVVRQGNAIAVERLCKNGAAPNKKSSFGWTPLHLAALKGNVDVIKVLLKSGANPDLGHDLPSISTFSGCTALHYACIIDDAACVKALLDAGANPSLANLAGKKPIDYAKSNAMRWLLESYIIKNGGMAKGRAVEETHERRKYTLELQLKENIVGQEAAIDTVASAIRRKEGGWIDKEHPLVFLFLGSSGIGKTELAKQVAYYLNSEYSEGFIRFDMSEYQNKHEVSKLIGSPPGYAGYKEGGKLTKELEKCPNAVVLFDEVDKAHPDVLTVLLQLFDEGRITSGRGKTIVCKDAIFIMTSNLANDEIINHALRKRHDHEAEVAAKQRTKSDKEVPSISLAISREFYESTIRPILKRHFGRDEFLGRINEFVYFFPFSRNELHQLVKKELDFWAEKAKDRYDVVLSWDGQVLDALCHGYNVAYGARSVKYEVEREVVSLLSNLQQFHGFPRGALLQLYVDYGGNGSSTDAAHNPQICLRIKNKDSGKATEMSPSVRHSPPTAVPQRTVSNIDKHVFLFCCSY